MPGGFRQHNNSTPCHAPARCLPRMYPPWIKCSDFSPVRSSTWRRIGSLSPALSLPSLLTSTPRMARLAVSAANCTFTAGLKPPLGIFITRASASVVLTRGCRARICSPRWPWPASRAASACFCFSSGNCATASSSRLSFSAAARLRAARCHAESAACCGESTCRRNSSACRRASASGSPAALRGENCPLRR